MMGDRANRRLQRIGGGVARWSLVLFFVGFGLLKFTAGEAEAIHPFIASSPLLSWSDAALGRQGASNLIGVIELPIGVLIALRPVVPRLSGIGSLGAAVALVTTLSFLFTTPAVGDNPWISGFLAKDLTLLGVALWSAGEAFAAAALRKAEP